MPCVICVFRLVLAWLALAIRVVVFVSSYVARAAEDAAVAWEAFRVVDGTVLPRTWSLEFEGHVARGSASDVASSLPVVALLWLTARQIAL